MNPLLEPYCNLAPFLELSLGPDHEIVIYELGDANCVVAAENSHISGAGLNDPLPPSLKARCEDARKTGARWDVHLLERANNKALQVCLYYIRDNENTIIGVFRLTFDDSRLYEMANRLLGLFHPDGFYQGPLLRNADNPKTDETGMNMEEDALITPDLSSIIEQTIAQSEIPLEKMRTNEKVFIVDKLKRRGVFSTKGAVAMAAKAMNCSVPTMYRYINRKI